MIFTFFLLLQPLCLIVFLCGQHSCILSHFKIIRCIVKSLIATSVWVPKRVYWSPKQPEYVTDMLYIYVYVCMHVLYILYKR